MRLYKFTITKPVGGALCVVSAASRDRALDLARQYAFDLEAEFNFPRGTCASWLEHSDVVERDPSAEGVVAWAEC